MNHYFGQPWDAPFIDDAEQIPTPVGEPCLACEEPIAEGDQGVVMPYVYLGPDGKPATRSVAEHRECMLLGLLGHVAGTCFCHDGLGGHRERGQATVTWLAAEKEAQMAKKEPEKKPREKTGEGSGRGGNTPPRKGMSTSSSNQCPNKHTANSEGKCFTGSCPHYVRAG